MVIDETKRTKDRQDVMRNQLVVIQQSGVSRHRNRRIGCWSERDMRRKGVGSGSRF